MFVEKNHGEMKAKLTPAHRMSRWCHQPLVHTLRLQYYFIGVALCGCLFLLYYLNSSTYLYIVESYDEYTENIKEVQSSYFTMKTSGCTIPSLSTINTNITQYVSYPKSFKKCERKLPPLFESNMTHLWIVEEYIPFYNVTKNLQCCTIAFTRPKHVQDIYDLDVDMRHEYDDKCESFTNSTKVIRTEFLQVVCIKDNKTVYRDFFVFPQRSFISSSNATNEHYNVLILGVDAVSRLNFHRTMPKTLKFLQNNDAIEFIGYNKVGDNTFPNLVPILTGLAESELKDTCLPTATSYFDNCPFVWHKFKDAGFSTAYGEDSASLGTFNYFKPGFLRKPTDHYYFTFMNEAQTQIGNNKDWNTPVCLGSRESYKVLLKYAMNVAVISKNATPFFGIFWETSMTHDYLNYPMLIDEVYQDFLMTLQSEGMLNDTVVVILSDHGIRWGPIRATKQGRYEERLPLLEILLPPSFKNKYGLAYRNLQTNSRRLISPFDIHATLLNLVDNDRLSDDYLESEMTKFYSNKRGISMFLPIMENRTCESAGISSHWCACHVSKNIDIRKKNVSRMASFALKYLNDMLEKYPQCVSLTLDEIIEATQNDLNESAMIDVDKLWMDYTIVFRVNPSKAIFESTIRREKGNIFNVTGTVSRLNQYGNQSRCVDNYKIKLYCYCSS